MQVCIDIEKVPSTLPLEDEQRSKLCADLGMKKKDLYVWYILSLMT